MEVADAMSAVLVIRDLRLRRGAREILAGVDLSAGCGELVALMGLSGAGKSTVLRAVAGLEPFDTGSLQVDDVTLAPGRRTSPSMLAPLRRKIGMVFQFHALFEHLTALENVCLAPVHVLGRSHAEAAARARVLLDELGVGARASALPRELSGGEAQRVAIARALAMDPPVLLLDEPTASLDPARCNELGESLRTLAASGRALVMTCHDDGFVRDHATRVVILADGRVVEAGDPRIVLDNPSHPATRALLLRTSEVISTTERPRK
jgi:ABC-type polar amino acid transport system ATPase subunit